MLLKELSSHALQLKPRPKFTHWSVTVIAWRPWVIVHCMLLCVNGQLLVPRLLKTQPQIDLELQTRKIYVKLLTNRCWRWQTIRWSTFKTVIGGVDLACTSVQINMLCCFRWTDSTTTTRKSFLLGDNLLSRMTLLYLILSILGTIAMTTEAGQEPVADIYWNKTNDR